MPRPHTLDGAVLQFDRASGLNLLMKSPATQELTRAAPRALQVGLLTPCNLACSFCYRDQSAPSHLTAPFLVDLLEQAWRWGVLEVAFGGGEPLLFRGFADLLKELRAQTGLGLNFTTNGTLLTATAIASLRDSVDEIRVSAYPENGYRETLRRLHGEIPFGVNWLVTPANVGMVEPFVEDFLSLGARDVLLLGYKGADANLHLNAAQRSVLREAILRIHARHQARLALRLDVCWYPHFLDLPHLFERSDCQAGDEFLVITPDRAVQPCSFHHERIPFEDFAGLQRIYRELRERRPPARVDGCTRADFVPVATLGPPAAAEAWLWPARASNNSGDATIIGRFPSRAKAEQVAQALQRLAREHEEFLVENASRLVELDLLGKPTPPLKAFANAHGFRWSEGWWWEEDGGGAPILTAGTVGKDVVVYHPYCMGLPEDSFGRYFEKMGGYSEGYLVERPALSIKARGRNDEAVAQIVAYFEACDASTEHLTDVGPPPWGDKATDPRLDPLADRSARLHDLFATGGGPRDLRQSGQTLRIMACWENPFAGSLAIEKWLRYQGYTDIVITMEISDIEIEGE